MLWKCNADSVHVQQAAVGQKHNSVILLHGTVQTPLLLIAEETFFSNGDWDAPHASGSGLTQVQDQVTGTLNQLEPLRPPAVKAEQWLCTAWKNSNKGCIFYHILYTQAKQKKHPKYEQSLQGVFQSVSPCRLLYNIQNIHTQSQGSFLQMNDNVDL